METTANSKLIFSEGILLVPIRVKALLLSEDIMATEAMADFTKLPWTDGTEDYNPDTANISENILSPAFGSRNLQLKAGIHLHWSLPTALRKQLSSSSPLVNTAAGNGCIKAPNRWLVTRINKKGAVELQVVVESDYLHPETNDPNLSFVNIPSSALDSGQRKSAVPFRYLGRSLELSNWLSQDNEGNSYWNHLTTLGYGEPAFASFYPNCHSVFGFYDDIDATAESDVKYEVIGWYSEINNDPLAALLNADKTLTGQGLKEAILENFNWACEAQNGTPGQILCYGTVTPSYQDSETGQTNSITGALADNPSSALASLLGKELLSESDSPEKFEEQMEAILLSHKLNSQSPDFGPKLKEARHEKGFAVLEGGTRWRLKFKAASQSANNSGETNTTNNQNTLPKKLPENIGNLLNKLNQNQKVFDKQSAVLISRKHQLFSDWYKYMISVYPPYGEEDSYPDPDEVKFFIQQEIHNQVGALQSQLGKLSISKDDESGVVTGATCQAQNTLAAAVAYAVDNLLNALSAWAENNQGQPDLLLIQEPAERFYQPADPVLMLSGDGLTPTEATGALECYVLTLSGSDISEQFASFNQAVQKLDMSQPLQNKFNPIFFEWDVQFFPVKDGNNRSTPSKSYSKEYLNQNYSLANNTVELSPRSQVSFMPGANMYQGRSYISAKAGVNSLKSKLEEYLLNWVVPVYISDLSKNEGGESSSASVSQQVSSESTDPTSEYLTEHLSEIISWAKKQYIRAFDQLPYSALMAYNKLQSMKPVSQMLGGFHDALLMHKLTLQLAINDPIGFEDGVSFTSRVASAVGDYVKSAPLPELDFNPIRAGNLMVNDLKVVGTFGLTQDVEVNWVGNETMPFNEGNGFLLPPRFCQPCQVDGHWISAADDEIELNDHPATTPICGWLLPNNLDNSLVVYDNQGNSLGSITTDAAQPWHSSPGDPSPISVSQISNYHLQSVVQFIINQGAEYLDNFISALDSGLQNIQPEKSAQNIGLSILMGRPIAVTRISVAVNAEGELATDQSWDSFLYTLQHGERSTDQFQEIDIPIRIGEFSQLNDGVLGYWKEPYSNEGEDTFYAVQSMVKARAENSAAPIISHTQNPVNLSQSLNSDPVTLTVLFDPRAKLHITTGVLPTKVLEIPPSHYSEALQKIQISFLTAPVLTGEGIGLPLPTEPGYSWSFNQLMNNGTWQQTQKQGIVTFEQVTNKFSNGSTLWSQMITNNWIQLDDQATSLSARIVPKDQRTMTDLGALAAVQHTLESFLDDLYLTNVDAKARFLPNIRIREGWLKLTPEVQLTTETQDSTSESDPSNQN